MNRIEAGVQTVVRHTVGRYSDYPERLLDPKEVFGNIVPVMLDNFRFPTATAERVGDNSHLVDQLIPAGLRRSLLDMTSTWQDGESRGAIITVGTRESGSAHPHFFEAKRTAKGVDLLFVDPEKTVGSRNFFKPPVVNLIAARILDDPDTTPEFVYLRFRSTFLEPQAAHVPAQYLAAQELLETEGQPRILNNNPEAILLRISLTYDRSIVQARLVPPRNMNRFIEQGRGDLVLDHRISELRKIMEYFPKSLELTGHEAQSYKGVMRRVQELEVPKAA